MFTRPDNLITAARKTAAAMADNVAPAQQAHYFATSSPSDPEG